MDKSHTFEDFELFTHVSNAFLCIATDTTSIEIKQDFPTIVIEGDRDNSTKFFIEVLEWDRDIDYVIHSLDSFEITSDFEQGYISFFMKPNNHA